jgi:hypothetical protein
MFYSQKMCIPYKRVKTRFNFLCNEGREELKHTSIWWRDLCGIGSKDEGGWFGNNINNVLGDGKEMGFWKEKWIARNAIFTLHVSDFIL